MMPTWDVLIKTTGQLICLSLQWDWVLGAAPQACQFWTEGEATLSLCCLPFLVRIRLTASWNWIIPSSIQIKKAQISKKSVCPYFCENKHDGVRLYEESPFLYTTAEPIGLLDLTGLLFTDWPGLPGKAGKVKKEASGTVHPSSGRRRKKKSVFSYITSFKPLLVVCGFQLMPSSDISRNFWPFYNDCNKYECLNT